MARAPIDLAEIQALIGTVLGGKYRIERLVGAGGVGAVYYGRRQDLGGEIAVKVLHQARRAEQFARRFRKEASLLSHLHHPNIVEMLDFGEDGEREFLVMEYVPGRTLGSELSKGPMAWKRAARVARQVALALATAHQRGVIHRDLKPGNVMLVDLPGAADHVKVLDFGIAQIVETEDDYLEADDTGAERGMVIGTPKFMSPEQCLGHPVDGRSDLYSLGVLLFCMLTGRAPFQGSTRSDILRAQLQALVPMVVAPGHLQAVPEPLVALVRRMLEKSPPKRPATAQEVIAALDKLGAGQAGPITEITSGPRSLEEVREGARRSRARWPLMVAAAVALLLAVPAGVLLHRLGASAPTSPERTARSLRLVVGSRPPGAQVLVAGHALGLTPLLATPDLPRPVLDDPARYEVRLAGYELASFDLSHDRDEEGERIVATAELRPLAPPAPADAPPQPAAERSGGRRIRAPRQPAKPPKPERGAGRLAGQVEQQRIDPWVVAGSQPGGAAQALPVGPLAREQHGLDEHGRGRRLRPGPAAGGRGRGPGPADGGRARRCARREHGGVAVPRLRKELRVGLIAQRHQLVEGRLRSDRTGPRQQAGEGGPATLPGCGLVPPDGA